MTTPTDIGNRALDAIGRSDLLMGDITEGTDGSQKILRVYNSELRQLLRASHWTFARKMAPLLMLADATGNTQGVGTVVPQPWVYEYAFPNDMLQARFLPYNYLIGGNVAPAGNISLPNVPPTTVSQAPLGPGMRLIPAPFLITTDTNYPVDLKSNWQDTPGVSPAGRSVILTNVNQANLVYTMLMPYPTMWDPMFEQTMVNMITQRIAMPLAKDQKFGLAMRDAAIRSVKDALQEARAASANEASFPQTTDHTPDFLRIRNRGAGWAAGGPALGWGGENCGPGVLGYGWGGCGFADGSVY